MDKKLDQILNFTQDLIFEFDEIGTYLNIWTSNEKFLLKPKKELIGRKFSEFVTKESGDFALKKISESIRSKIPAKMEYHRTTSEDITHFKCIIMPLLFQGKTTAIVHAKNITSEKTKESRLNKIEKLAKVGTWELDIFTNKKICSDQVFNIYDLPKTEELDFNIALNLFDNQSKKLIQKAIDLCINNKETYDLELCLDKTQTKKFVRATGLPIFGADGKVIKIAGVMQDITEHNKLNKAFLAQKGRLTRVLQQAPGIFFQFQSTPQGDFSFPYVSENLEKILGYDPLKVMDGSESLIERIFPEDRDTWKSALTKSIEKLSDFEWKGRVFDKTNKLKWIMTQSSPNQHPDGTIVWDGVIFDITKRKLEEDELEEKQKSVNHQLKLASLGELAAGVAHEINNPLSIVNNVLERINRLKEKDDLDNSELSSLIEYALDASKRIEKITKGLRIFSRADVQTVGNFNITDSVSTTVELITELYRSKNVEIDFECDQKEHLIYGNRGRIDQVLMNLVSNAKDAVSSKKNGRIKIQLFCDDEDCYLNVMDNGTGIPENISEKIFDPFFSTKEVGKGTGIGLSLANSIILEHNGTIEFETSDKGTVFKVKFPKSRPSKDN